MATVDKMKRNLARPGRYGAATTRNNNSGKGLDAYKSGKKKVPSGNGAATTDKNNNGKGLRAYIPRKRRPKVAVPKRR